MKRDYYFKLQCEHKECSEFAVYSYKTRKEYIEGRERNKSWLCVRHSTPKNLLSLSNKKTESIIMCKKKMYMNTDEVLGKFWQREEHFGTEKVSSGFQSGNGYKAFAEDFPEGTIIKITAEVVLPKKQ